MVGGAVLVLAVCAVFWWLAIPRHEICPMISPAPAGCNSGRVPIAAFWSAVLVGSYVVLLLAVRRQRHRWWTVAVLGLVFGSVFGYYSVLFA